RLARARATSPGGIHRSAALLDARPLGTHRLHGQSLVVGRSSREPDRMLINTTSVKQHQDERILTAERARRAQGDGAPEDGAPTARPLEAALYVCCSSS